MQKLHDDMPGQVDGFRGSGDGPTKADDTMIKLTRLPVVLEPRLVDDVHSFLAATQASLRRCDAREYNTSLPLFVDREDHNFLVEKHRALFPIRLDTRLDYCVMRKEVSKFVVLARGAEGVIFDENGVSNNAGYLRVLSQSVPGLKIEGAYATADMKMLQGVPRLKGSYVVFYDGNLNNWWHWLIEALVPLEVICDVTELQSTLLLPPFLGSSSAIRQRDTLNGLGFSKLPHLWAIAPIVWVEEVVWIDRARFDLMPRMYFESLRRRAMRELRCGEEVPNGTRIYIRRTGNRSVINDAEIGTVLAEAGFTTYDLEELTAAEQARLFQRAEFVIGVHGAGFGNLIFSPPGTKVIDMMPDVEARPFAWLLAAKLGQSCGVLRCRSLHKRFNSPVEVDVNRLIDLMELLRESGRKGGLASGDKAW
jgi:capsular polysaccharide biosynthesis protein